MKPSALGAHWRCSVATFSLAFAATCCALAPSSSSAATTCRADSKALARTLAQSSGAILSSGVRYFRATAYIKAGCLDKALSELDSSDRALAAERPKPNNYQVRVRAGEALRSYIAAMKLLASEQRQAAVDQLLALMDSSRATDVMWLTMMALGELLSDKSSPEEWERFDQSLATLSSSEAKFWQVDLFRRLKEVRDGRAHSAIATLGDELSQDLPSHRHLSLQVVLLEVLVADRRFVNARVHCAWLDRPIGERLIDVDQRVRYLRACRTAWHAAPSKGSDVAGRAVRVFDAAIRAFEEET